MQIRADGCIGGNTGINKCNEEPADPLEEEPQAEQEKTWYKDADNDGWNVGTKRAIKSPGTGWNLTSTKNGDCDDTDPNKTTNCNNPCDKKLSKEHLKSKAEELGVEPEHYNGGV